MLMRCTYRACQSDMNQTMNVDQQQRALSMQRLVEEKLKVTLESPPAPPSPVQEASETTEFAAASPTVMPRSSPAASGATAAAGDVYAENRQLREKLAMVELRDQESVAALKVGSKSRGKAAEQISLLHLVLVAIVAYILGLYLH